MICCDFCEEWYHGDCIGITEKESKAIKKYYCDRCRETDPTLRTVFKGAPSQPAPSSSLSSKDKDSLKKKKEKGESRCGHCDGCRSRAMGKKGKCEKRLSSYQIKKKEKKIKEGRVKKRKRSMSPEIFINPALEGPRHCYGTGCRNTARPQSKYCSDECGIKLGSARIFQFLPARMQEWNCSSSVATEQNKKALEKNRAKQQTVRTTLLELDKRHKELDTLVELSKMCPIDEKFKENIDIEDESSMYCVTCGHEIHTRTAIRHMERCFNKYESQASFGSIFKTRIEGGELIFCDFYNPISQTYCKRLRILCPEHSKDPKVNDDDVCGSPMTKNVFELTGEFCRAPKKSCFKHYCWEKIRRAEIDMERVRQWLKMDELILEEQQIKKAMSSRSGLLGLLLNSTFDHQFATRMELAKQKAQEGK